MNRLRMLVSRAFTFLVLAITFFGCTKREENSKVQEPLKPSNELPVKPHQASAGSSQNVTEAATRGTSTTLSEKPVVGVSSDAQTQESYARSQKLRKERVTSANERRKEAMARFEEFQKTRESN